MAIKLEDIEIFSNSLGNNFGGGGTFGGSSSGGGTNLTGIPNADYLQNLANLLQQQQGPQLGPDDFGSYSIPASDPTYRTGFDYARSIAGGIPMSQVIAPGVSYSPEQPMGYTQEQLNRPKDMPAPPPPPRSIDRRGDDVDFLGTGIGGVNIPVDRKQDFPPLSNLLNIGKLFGGGFDKDAIEKIVQERIAESKKIQETKPDMPTFIPEVPTGRDFSIDREILERPMISGLENRDFMDADSLITGVPTGREFSIDRDRQPIYKERQLPPPQDFGYGPGIMPPLPPMDIRDIPPKINDQIFIDDRPIIDERIVDRGYGPGIMPPLPPMDIINLPPVDLPPINIPSRIPADLPPIVGFPPIRSIGKSNLNRFSIEQLPMGLFV